MLLFFIDHRRLKSQSCTRIQTAIAELIGIFDINFGVLFHVADPLFSQLRAIVLSSKYQAKALVASAPTSADGIHVADIKLSVGITRFG